MHARLANHEIVLLGAGHTNAHVLQMWRMSPLPDARLTCISDFPIATYSGMLPGTLAGFYRPDQMQIDLVRLCASIGVRLIVDKVTGLDVSNRALHFAERPPLRFDALSIGIGSVPTKQEVESIDATALAIKPMQTFLSRLEQHVLCWQRGAAMEQTFRAVVVGGGAAGTEIAFCLLPRLNQLLSGCDVELTLVERNAQLAADLPRGARRRIRRGLGARRVKLLLGRSVERVESQVVTLDDRQSVHADLVIWSTGAAAPPLLTRLGLSKDPNGFLLTHPSLQTIDSESIFAVGDAGTIRFPDGRLDTSPKAGVYAVRQGPVLWQNIGRLLRGHSPVLFRPQRGFLRLLCTGDGRAIAAYRGLTARGKWCWRLKHFIDTRFMAPFHAASEGAMSRAQSRDAAEEPTMRCRGCGGKVGGGVLRRVLQRLEIPAHEQVVLGLDAADDAAIIRPQAGQGVAMTADFFAAPFDDAYLVGRIAAVNAASDVFAMGAVPTAALALATIPPGPAERQEELLYELLFGATEELRKMGATLAGGHTIEGPRVTMGLSMLAGAPQTPYTKAGLRVGDVLVLTKSLGTGVLLAALMQGQLRATSHSSLVSSMLGSNQVAARIVGHHKVSAMTDVTGFGLAGHLIEMLAASNVACEIKLASLSLLPGAAELFAEGAQSTLAPANRDAEEHIAVLADQRRQPEYAALFDPQTSGGLLFGAHKDDATTLIQELIHAGEEVRSIGRIVSWKDGEARIRCVTM